MRWQWRLTLRLLLRPCVCVILNGIFKISLIYHLFLSVPFDNFFTGTDINKAKLMVTSDNGHIEVDFPPPTEENEVRAPYHESDQGVFQHSQNWLVIVVILVSVAALAMILIIKRWRHQKKTKGKWFGYLADQYQYLGNCPPTPPLTRRRGEVGGQLPRYWYWSCLAAEGFSYVRLFGEHGMGYVTFDVRMSTWVQWIKRHRIQSLNL